MPEFRELSNKFEKIDDAYVRLRALNMQLINTPFEEELRVLINEFKEIQGISSTQKQLLEIDINEFEQGDLSLEQFSRRIAIRTYKVSDITFDLDMEINPKLLLLSRKLTEPVLEAAETAQQNDPSVKKEAENLQKNIDEVNSEPDAVERINKTLTLLEKVMDLGKKVYPLVKDKAPKLFSLASMFI